MTQAPTRPRILLVEDEETMRTHLAELLSDEFDVETAADGEQALIAVLRTRPELVITDIVMPLLDGVELVRLLRETPSTSTIPILLTSGRAPDELRIEGFEMGADSFLAKPYSGRELRARIRTMLQSERRRHQAARLEGIELAAAERAALLESITDSFYALDEQDRITYANQRALDFFGRPRAELLGESIWALMTGAAAQAALREAFQRARAEQRPVALAVLSNDDRWLEVHAFPGASGLAVNFRDITDLKRGSDALKAAEQRYRAFVANSSEAIWRYELDQPLDLSWPVEQQLEFILEHARLAELNDAMARMYGFTSADEMVGAPLSATLPPEDPAALAYLRRVIEARYHLPDVESEEKDREGNTRYFSNSITPVIENGKLLRAWGTQRDITDRKLNERRKDEFVATLAHELRNPLAPIRNGIHLLKNGKAGPDAQRVLGMMDRQMAHMVRLLDDLLDLSRISRGRLELKREIVPMSKVLAAAVESTSHVVEARHHHLEMQLLDPELQVDGDPTRLSQIFANLISNSAKYTEPGGEIIVMQRREGQDCVVSVTDTGIGIPPHAQDQLFEMFSQVRVHQPHAESGLGIGLSVVKTLVQMHGGSVTAHSDGPGTGSTFTVRLPAAAQPALARPAARDTEPPAARTEKILVVDDNRDAAQTLAILLQGDGHQVQTAFGGEEAVTQAATFRPDVILMDLGMPTVDGYEATKRIRALDPSLRPAIFALTGWGQANDRRRSSEVGMDGHLVKPVDPELLRQVISSRQLAPTL